MKTLIIAALVAAIPMTLYAAPTQTKTARRAAPLPAGKVETMRVSAISLVDEDGTTITLKGADGVKLDPVKVPLAICRKDHLGRLLPGMDVAVAVETRTVAGKRTRFVRPERFRPWCN